jgi:hypothetical protein
VTCSECGIKAHAECLEKCPIHSVMVASSLHKSQANQLKISSILIVCLRCLKNHPKNRIRCIFLPKLQETIFCPIKIIQATPENLKRDISSNTRMIENKEPEDSLGKREAPSIEESSEEALNSLVSILKTDIHKEYVSLNCLIELRKHNQILEFDTQEKSFKISEDLLTRYLGYRCVCNTPCSFECSACYQYDRVHTVCLQEYESNIRDNNLVCVDCSLKAEPKPKKKEARVAIEAEPETKIRKPKEIIIAFRKGPSSILKAFDAITTQVITAKIDLAFLK